MKNYPLQFSVNCNLTPSYLLAMNLLTGCTNVWTIDFEIRNRKISCCCNVIGNEPAMNAIGDVGSNITDSHVSLVLSSV